MSDFYLTLAEAPDPIPYTCQRCNASLTLLKSAIPDFARDGMDWRIWMPRNCKPCGAILEAEMKAEEE